MSTIFEYVRTCFFEKFPRNLSLGNDYMDEVELASFFLGRIQVLMSDFNISDELPLEEYSWKLFDEFKTAGLVDSFRDPVAGEYFWVDLKTVGQYMSSQLSDSEIYARKKLLRDDRLYEAVFAKVGDNEIPIEERESTLLEPVEVPASDRIVRLGHNQISAVEDEARVFFSVVDAEWHEPNVPDESSLAFGKIRAGLELVRASILELQLFRMSMIAGLNLLVERHKDHAIGAAASNLLSVILKQVGIL